LAGRISTKNCAPAGATASVFKGDGRGPRRRSRLGRIARLTGKKPIALVPVARGYTRARRLIVRFADGSSVFAKLATDANTANWLHAEHRIYARLAGRAGFLPALIGWDPGDDDATALPLLLLEDLSAATWPPPWTARRVDAVLAALADVRAALPLLADLHLRHFRG
jgi:hypothetical protein